MSVPRSRAAQALLAAAAAAAIALAFRYRRRKKPRLVLHFDVNETLLVGDPAGGDTFEDCLNKICAKNAFVRLRAGAARRSTTAASLSDLEWWDGTAMDGVSAPPPLREDWAWPPGAVPFYDVDALKKFRKTFTCQEGSPGVVYRPVYERMKAALLADGLGPPLCADGAHHFLLPAFWATLAELERQKREFTVVIRTFGTDGPQVGEAIAAWTAGGHGLPSVPDFTVNAGWHCRFAQAGLFSLNRGAEVLSELDAVEAIESDAARCWIVTDHYEWWRDNKFNPEAGKPVWITLDDAACHHVIFDDNIKYGEKSIVALRVRRTATDPFVTVPQAAARELHGTFLMRCPTFAPILDPRWFLERIAESERQTARLGRVGIETVLRAAHCYM